MVDLAIIGAGPAGASAARAAAQLGMKVLLFDKCVFPRAKPCGGALSEQAISYLDFHVPQDLQERDVFGARVVFGDTVLERRKDHRIATLITRSVFDALLLEKARETGVEIRLGDRVTGYGQESDRVVLRSSSGLHEARFLVVAEGAHGNLKHEVRKRDTKSQYGVCVVAEIPASEATIDARIHDAIEIHFGVAHRGYGWVFPHRGYFSVGIGGLARDLPEPRRTMGRFLTANGFSASCQQAGHLIPAGGIKRRIRGDRCLLAGDAAGFVDSFYGEGIAYAIRSGQLSAQAIHLALTSGDSRRAFAGYEADCWREFEANLRSSLFLSNLMHRFPGPLFSVFCTHPEVLDRFLDVPALRTSYRQYVHWLMPRAPMYLLSAVMMRSGSAGVEMG